MGSDFYRAARKFERLPNKIEREANDAVSDTLDTTATLAKANLGANETNWTRRTRQSIRTRHLKEGGVDKHVLRAGGSQAPHAKYVELGTGTFFDPTNIDDTISPYDAPTFSETLVDNIYEWVQTKPVTPRYYNNKRDLAWAISETISHLGTGSQPFVRPAWYATEDALRQNVGQGVEDALRWI